ncbi:MAG: hypothetical protein Q8Q01_00765 [archaeon]|nr:hypothetical protein [archaeon]
MTLDVRIGKKIGDSSVEQCPDAKENICDPLHTNWPTESYRSGNNFSFWKFFTKNKDLKAIYLEMRKHPNTNDLDLALIKPFLKRINKLKDADFVNEVDKDRLKWLKYWSNKAVELYGNEAAILFS